MTEYIDREAFKKSVEGRYCKPCKAEGKDHNERWCRTCWVDDMLDEADCFQPSDVAPVKHGRWFKEDRAVTCSNCGRCYDSDFEIKAAIVMKFEHCPDCGAIMDEERGVRENESGND
jgi:hypothetical protein